jgi:hypothetical protein
VWNGRERKTLSRGKVLPSDLRSNRFEFFVFIASRWSKVFMLVVNSKTQITILTLVLSIAHLNVSFHHSFTHL